VYSNPSLSKLFFLAAFILALLATLTAAGIVTGSMPWLLPAAVTALALAFVVG
jgi:hypothetical protein